ncbi:MAG TPA: hypothetical protein VG796_19715 [Verrucomicrobiales bacterium]|nr:hypothetical protein [Verrucomicrobiales bacterium]
MQQASPPVTKKPATAAPTLTPEEREALRAGHVPLRLTWLHVTVHSNGLSYIEWTPTDGSTERFAAWSNANFHALSVLGQFDLENDRTRNLVIPLIKRARVSAGSSTNTSAPFIPPDGPGFVLVKGDAANTRAVNPVAAFHQIYKTDAVNLALKLEERERRRAVEAAAESPATTPGDIVIQFWPKKSRRQSTVPSTP